MLGVGLGVRLMVAVAPAPPVPAPPGKPPLPLCSSLRHRSSGWWFSNGDAHGRDSTTATTSSRATRRKWWSDPDGSQEDYGSSSLEEDEYGYGYDYDYEDEAAFPGFGGAAELFDEPWFSKVSYICTVYNLCFFPFLIGTLSRYTINNFDFPACLNLDRY